MPIHRQASPKHATMAVLLVGAAVAVLLMPRPAEAIIKIPNSVYKLWEMSTQVVEAKAAGFDAAGNEIQATVAEATQPRASKDAPLAGTLRIQVDKSVTLPARPKAGDPLVMFVGRRGGAALHVGDAWFQAQAGAAGAFSLTQAYAEGAAAYPGSTAGLLRVVASVKKNPKQPPPYDSISPQKMAEAHWPLRDHFEHANWGKTFDLGELGVKAAFMVAAEAPPADTARLTSKTLAQIKATSFGKNYWPMEGFQASLVIDLMGGDGRRDRARGIAPGRCGRAGY